MFNIIKDNLFWWFILFLAIVAPSFLFGAFQLVFAIIAAFVVVLLVGMLWLRWKIKRAAGSGSQQYNSYTRGAQQQSQQRQSRNTNAEPDVKIFVQQSEKKVSDKVGDYVDFEELDDAEARK